MKLTKFDVARLKGFQRSRLHPPTAIGFLWRIKPLLLAMGIVKGIVFLIPVALAYKCFVAGFAAGGCFCISVLAVKLPSGWPLTREVLNWERVDQLLKENDNMS